MPPSGALQQADIDTIRQWISAGAIDDSVQASAPIRVTSLSVTPGSTLTAAPAQIIAGFDRELDASTANANTFILEASNNDGTFGNGNDIAITAASISVPRANPQSAVFDLTGVALADDTYQVRLLGSGASIIMDLDANALDGEFSGTFPSGNNAAGGDFAAQFMIATPVVIGPTPGGRSVACRCRHQFPGVGRPIQQSKRSVSGAAGRSKRSGRELPDSKTGEHRGNHRIADADWRGSAAADGYQPDSPMDIGRRIALNRRLGRLTYGSGISCFGLTRSRIRLLQETACRVIRCTCP